MAAKGYTTISAVAGYLGRVLTQAQQTQATALFVAGEAFVDRVTNRAWNIGPISGEQYRLTQPDVYLKSAPVASVQAVSWRTTQVGDTPRALTAAVEYELLDPAMGWLRVVTGYTGRDSLLLVSYTPALPCPDDVAHATALLVAHWLTYSIDPDRYGLSQYKLGDELQVRVDDTTTAGLIPAEVTTILRQNKRTIIA